jgi:hypothetical protein
MLVFIGLPRVSSNVLNATACELAIAVASNLLMGHS